MNVVPFITNNIPTDATMTTYNRERQIDVQRSSQHVVDTEFDSMRERFENEMRRVEAEMARLRHEFEGVLCGMRFVPLAFACAPLKGR